MELAFPPREHEEKDQDMNAPVMETMPRKWNAAPRNGPPLPCFHLLFEEQVERTPDAVAVACQDQELTYRELNRRANILAHYLRTLGVGPDILVGICLEHSLELMVGLLGILKAGGAYVPLDPTYPKERLSYMLEDARVPILLAQQRLLPILPTSVQTQIICLDRPLQASGEETGSNPVSGVQPTHLAYVIYTSGSTGRPKGVMIVHRGLSNYLVWCAERYRVAAGAGALVHSSISFDLTITGLFAPLLVGRTVFLLAQGSGIEPLLAAWRRLRNMSLIKITPGHLQLLNYHLEPNEAAGRTNALIIGGENLLAESVTFWQKCSPHTMLINEYGPTETVVGCCIYQVPREGLDNGAIPIGRPIANTRLYVLDPDQKPVPTGVEGELYIGGDGVARGYLHRPELTREKFLPDPFDDHPDRFVFRTGDLVRCREDGNIEFLGRIDDQVKIRGFRVELGEIDGALREHPAVRESATLLREEAGGHKRLIAYLVLHAGRLLPTEEARQFLRQRLPDYMMPQAFVYLDAMPLTASGKLDRRALPEPGHETAASPRQHGVPRDALELQLVTIVEELLAVHPIGIDDDFFALGGNSLLAAQLFTKIARKFQKKLPLAILLEAPTVAKLGQLIRAEGWAPQWTCLVPIQPEGSKPPFYCIHPVGGNVLGYLELARCLGPDRPVYGIQAKGLDSRVRPHTQVHEMAAYYLAELRRLQPTGPYHLGGLSFGGTVAFEMAQQLRAAGQEVKVLALFDTTAPGYIKSLVRRIPAHLSHFYALAPNDKLLYLRSKVGRAFWRTHHALWRLGARLCAWTGIPLPRAMWNLTFINNAADENYVPKPYDGRVVLFRAQEQFIGTYCDALLGWRPFALQGIDVHEIPGNHLTFVEMPNVPVLARILQSYLDNDKETT